MPIGGLKLVMSGAADGAAGAGSATTTDLTLWGGLAVVAAAVAAAPDSFSEGPLAAADDLTSADMLSLYP